MWFIGTSMEQGNDNIIHLKSCIVSGNLNQRWLFPLKISFLNFLGYIKKKLQK